MGTAILMAAVYWAVVVKAVPQPSIESMTYQVEVEDHLMDFSIKGSTYFSVDNEAYRYDFSGGMSKLFIYPKKGKAYYYYPTSDFMNEEFNITQCWSFDTPVLKDLLSPLPSVDGFTDLGPDNVYDNHVEKYVREDPEQKEEIWVENHDEKTGIHLRPVLQVVKKWDISNNGLKEDLSFHQSTAYYGFIVGEQHSSVWERPSVTCDPAVGDQKIVAQIITQTALDINASPALLGSQQETSSNSSHPKITKTHHTGRRRSTGNEQDEPLSLPFPWTPAQYKSIAKKLPKSFDWRDFGAVTQVKNQRNCGSCWAHGIVGSLEGAYFLKYGQLIALSEQAMIDCAGSSDTIGCFGGDEKHGFLWVNQTGGIPPSEEYSAYQETNGYCRITDRTNLVAQLEGYYKIPNNTDAMRVALVNLGPIAVALDAAPLTYPFYKNGVIKDCNHYNLDHVVLLVGYGESTEEGPYWIIKNSWANNWALDGYGLISAEGNCIGILNAGTFPVLK